MSANASLRPDQPFARRPRPGAGICAALATPLETDDDIERICKEHDLLLEELDARLKRLRGRDNFAGPQVKATCSRTTSISATLDPR
jgi:hypothetical protein